MQNDPVNFIDPSGLNLFSGFCGAGYGSCGGGWENGGSGFSGNAFGDGGFFGDDGYGGGIPEGMPDSVRSSYQNYLQGLSISLAMSGRHFGFADGFHPFESTWGTSRSGAMTATELQQEKQQKDPCPPHIRQFFNELGGIFTYMKEKTGADINHFAALSSYESGWLNAHNKGLNNPFGLTQAGGNNLRFNSNQAAADYWLGRFGNLVKGSKTIAEFTTNLQKAPYNVVNKDWAKKVAEQDKTIQKYRTICGV